jgi:hypothetical protein
MSVVARDIAGNTARTWLCVTVDTIAPAVSISSPPNGSVVGNRAVTVSGTSETGAKIYYDGKLMATAGPFYSFNATLSEGMNEICVYAEDPAGNRNMTCIMVMVDSQAPFIDIDIANGTVTKAGSVTLTGRTKPGAVLSINGLSVPVAANGSFRTTVSLHVGNNTVSFFVRDTAGNTAAQQRTIVREARTLPGPDGGTGTSKSDWKQEWTAAIIISIVALVILVLALRPHRRFGAPSEDDATGGR